MQRDNGVVVEKVCVSAGLLYRDGRILLGKRALDRTSYPGVWDLPGGHCEPGELPDETLIRELREEIGIVPIAAAHIATLRIVGSAAEPIELWVYLVTGWRGEPENLLPEEHEALSWFTVDEAASLSLATPLYLDLFRQADTVAQRLAELQ